MCNEYVRKYKKNLNVNLAAKELTDMLHVIYHYNETKRNSNYMFLMQLKTNDQTYLASLNSLRHTPQRIYLYACMMDTVDMRRQMSSRKCI